VPPKPVPRPRTKRRKAPVALPRTVIPTQLPKKVSEKVKKPIDEITPYYDTEAINKFKENLKFIKIAEIIQNN